MPQEVYQHTFANGLTLLAERMPHVRSAALNFLVPAGCVYDPPKQRGIASVLADSEPGPHECVLRELLGARPISREPQAQRVHATHVRAVQRLERGLVVLLRTLDEIARVRLHRVARAGTVLGCRRTAVG